MLSTQRTELEEQHTVICGLRGQLEEHEETIAGLQRQLSNAATPAPPPPLPLRRPPLSRHNTDHDPTTTTSNPERGSSGVGQFEEHKGCRSICGSHEVQTRTDATLDRGQPRTPGGGNLLAVGGRQENRKAGVVTGYLPELGH